MSYKFQINLRPYHCLVRSNRPYRVREDPTVPSFRSRRPSPADRPKALSECQRIRRCFRPDPFPPRHYPQNNRRRRPPAIRLPNGRGSLDELDSGFSPLFIYLFIFTTRPTPRYEFYTRDIRAQNVPGASTFYESVLFVFRLFIYLRIRFASHHYRTARKGNRLNGTAAAVAGGWGMARHL